jgi:hypothetical protein
MSPSLLPASLLTLALLACDPPPDDFAVGDAGLPGAGDQVATGDDTATSSAGNRRIESESDTGPVGTTCLEAVICITREPAAILECTAGMDAEARAAATDAAVCIVANCAETIDTPAALVGCTASSCSEEALDCVTSSLGGLSF